MAETLATIDAPLSAVERVLLDAEAYPRWVVGTDRCERVDASWPVPGAGFTYSVSLGPFRFRDKTTMLEHQPGRQVHLHIAMRPFGEADVVLRYEPDGRGTRVIMLEHPIRGAARVLWNPLLDRLTRTRNTASLERLRRMVEEQADGERSSESSLS